MIAVNETIKSLYRGDSVPKKYEISVYRSNIDALFPANDLYPSDTLFPLAGGEADLVIGNDRIVSEKVRITQSICDSGDIIFGKCNAAELIFECADVGELYVGDELIVKQVVGDTPISIGAFYIHSIKKSADRRFKTITAYDRMTRFDIDVADWYKNLWSGGTTSITLAELRNSLCTFVGVPVKESTLVNDTLTVKKTIAPTELSGREVLEMICEINGVFGVIDNYGQLVFKSINTAESVENIPVSLRRNLDYEDFKVKKIDCLVIRQESNDIGATVGSGNNKYIMQGNMFAFGKSSAQLTAIANNIFPLINNVQYTPMKLTCRGLPYLEVGDCIDVIQTDGSTLRTVLLHRVLSGVQSLIDDINAYGNENRAETFGVSKTVTQIKNKQNILERDIELSKTQISDLESGYTDLEQRTGTLYSRITDAENNILQISQSAESMSIQITNAQGDISTLQQTANSFEVRITNVENNYAQKSQLSASIGAYIDSSAGTAKVVQACSATYQTKSEMSIYATSASVTTEINNGLASLSLAVSTSSYNNQTTSTISLRRGTTTISSTSVVGTTAAQVASITADAIQGITLSVTNGDTSSTFTLKAGTTILSSGTIKFNGIVTFSDLSGNGTTTINGANIKTGTISADRIDVNSLKLNRLYGGNGTQVALEAPDTTSIYVGGNGVNGDFTNIYLHSRNVYLGIRSMSAGLIFDGLSRLIRNENNGYDWSLGNSTYPFNKVVTKTLEATTYARMGASGGYISFFGATYASKKSVSSVTGSTVNDAITGINNLITALKSYGLIG